MRPGQPLGQAVGAALERLDEPALREVPRLSDPKGGPRQVQRGAVVARVVLVELRQIDQEPQRRARGARHRLRPEGPRVADPPRPPPEPAEPPGHPGFEPVGQARAERGLVEARAPVRRPPLEPAPRAHPLDGIVARIRAVEQRGGPRVEARERHEVPAVVPEDPRERAGIARAEIAEVDLGHERARQVVPPIDPEQRALEGREPAIRGAAPPERPGDGVEILVGQVFAPPARAREQVARFEQRQVEGAPVEGHERLRLGHCLPHRMEESRLGAEIAQEVLGHRDRARRGPRREADEEHVGARPARQARRLRVEEDRARARRRGSGDRRRHAHRLHPAEGRPVRSGDGLERERVGRRRTLRGVARREPLEPRPEPRQLELAIESAGRRGARIREGRGDHGRDAVGASRSGGREVWPPSAWRAGPPRSPGPRTRGTRTGRSTSGSSRGHG